MVFQLLAIEPTADQKFCEELSVQCHRFKQRVVVTENTLFGSIAIAGLSTNGAKRKNDRIPIIFLHILHINADNFFVSSPKPKRICCFAHKHSQVGSVDHLLSFYFLCQRMKRCVEPGNIALLNATSTMCCARCCTELFRALNKNNDSQKTQHNMLMRNV